MIKNLSRILIATILASVSIIQNGNAQSNGDYLSTSAGANWSSIGTWKIFSGGTWINATEYPGQTASSSSSTVYTSTAGANVRIDVSPAFPIANLQVPSGTLQFNNISQTLSVTGNVVVNGGTFTTTSTGSPIHTLYIGGNVTKSGGGSIALRSNSNVVNTLLYGTTASISATGTLSLNNLSFTGSTLSTTGNFNILGDLVVVGGSFNGGSIITFSQAGTRFITGSSNNIRFTNLALGGGGTVSTDYYINSPISVSGTLSLSNATADLNTIKVFNSGNITMQNGSTINRISGAMDDNATATTGSTYNVTYSNTSGVLNAGNEIPSNPNFLRTLTYSSAGAASSVSMSAVTTTIVGGSTLILNTNSSTALNNSGRIFFANNATIQRTQGRIQSAPDLLPGAKYNVLYALTGSITSDVELPIGTTNQNTLQNITIGNNTNAVLTLNAPTTVTGILRYFPLSAATTVLLNATNNITMASGATLQRTRGNSSIAPLVEANGAYNLLYDGGTSIISDLELPSEIVKIASVSVTGNNTILSLAGTNTNYFMNGNLVVNGNGNTAICFSSSTPQVVSVTGNTNIVAGILSMQGTGLSHQLYLSGSTNTFSALQTTANSGSSIYFERNGAQIVPGSTNYRNLYITGSGTKTSSGAISVNNTFSIAGSTFDPAANNLTALSGTTIDGTGSFTDSNNGGVNTFSNGLTNAGTFTSTSVTTQVNILFPNGLINNGIFNGGGATLGANQTIWANSLVGFASGLTDAGSLTLTGNGGFVSNGGLAATAGGSMYINTPMTISGGGILSGGAMTINTPSIISAGNISVGTFLSISGTGSIAATTAGSLSVANQFFNDGVFTDNNNAAASTFIGGIINNGTFNTSAVTTATNMIVRGNVVQNNTTAGSFLLGGAEFNTSSSTISGAGSITASATLNVTGATLTVTNINTGIISLSGTGQLASTGTWIQGANSYLTLGNPAAPTITRFDVSSFPNTVEYNGVSQAIRGGLQYSNLKISGSATNTTSANVTVAGSLGLQTGVTNIGNFNLTMVPGASVSGNALSNSNFIATNGSGNYIWQLNSVPASLSFPIGTGSIPTALYSPAAVSITAGTIGAPPASMIARAISGKAPNQLDNSLSLNKYWVLTASGISSLVADLIFTYDASEANVTYENAYVPACWTGSAWNISGTIFNRNISIPGVSFNVITCTAGPATAFQSGVFYSRQTGNWEDAASWSNVTVGGPAASTPPTTGSSVIIGNTDQITVNTNSKSTVSLSILSNAILELNTTSGHTFGNVSGTGTLQYTISNSTNPVLPGGTLTTFLGTLGGTVAYLGSGSYTIPQPTTNTYNNLVIGGGSASIKNKSNATGLTVNNQLIIQPNTEFLYNSVGSLIVSGVSSVAGTGTFTDNNNTAATTFSNTVFNDGIFQTQLITTPANLLLNGGFINNGFANLGGATVATANRTITANSPIYINNGFSTTGVTPITFAGVGGVSINGGNFSISNNITLLSSSSITIAGGNPSIAGNLVNDGNIFINTPGTFQVVGSTSIGSTGSIIDNDNTAATTFTQILTNNGTLRTTAITSSQNLLFNGGFTNNGTFAGAAASITAGVARTITANNPVEFSAGFNTTGATTLIIAGTAGVSISGGNFSLSNALTINTGSSIDFYTSGVVSIAGLVTNSGNLYSSITSADNLIFQGGLTNSTNPFNIPSASLAGTITATQPISFTGIGGVKSLGNNNVIFSGGSGVFMTGGDAIFNGNLTSNGPVTIHLPGVFSVTGTSAISANFTIETVTSAIFNGAFSKSGGVFSSTAITNTNQLIFNNSISASGTPLNIGSATISNNSILTATAPINFTQNLVANGNLTFTGGTVSFINSAPGISGSVFINTGALMGMSAFAGPALSVNIPGNITGGGSINFNGTASTLNLGGSINTFASITNGTNSTINYTGTNQTIAGVVYNIVNFPNAGSKTLIGTASLTRGATVPPGVSLVINPNAILQVSANRVIDNQGDLNIVGSSLLGVAMVRINGAGNFSIIQTTAGSNFTARYYQLLNLGNGGVLISDGSIDQNNTGNNFSNGLFANGAGSQYLNFNNYNFSPDIYINNATFTGGPTYNVSRTGATSGVVNFVDAAGTFSGSSFTNPVPTTYVIWDNPGNTYFSQANGNFSDVTNWRNSGGQSPTASDFTSGLASFTVRNNHTIAMDLPNLDVFVLQIGQNTSGSLRYENTISRNITVRSLLDIKDGGFMGVDNSGSATHTLDVRGNINTNTSGTLQLVESSSQVINTNFNSAYSQIIGTATPIFNNVTFNSLAVPSVLVTAANGMKIIGTLTINNNSTFNGSNFNHTIGGDWFVGATNASYIGTTTGTIIFDYNGVQRINTAATFQNVKFVGGQVVQINGNISVSGDVIVDNNTSVATGNLTHSLSGNFNVLSGNYTQNNGGTTNFVGTTIQTISGKNSFFANIGFTGGTKNLVDNFDISGNLQINTITTITGSDDLTVRGNITQNGLCQLSGNINMNSNGNFYLRSNVASYNLGTATLNLNGTANVFITTISGSSFFFPNGDINVNSGQLIVDPNVSVFGNGTNDFSIAAGARVFQRGTNNFPGNFNNYSIHPSSFVRLDQSFPQTLRINNTSNTPITFGNLEFTTGSKTITGSNCVLSVVGNIDFINNAVPTSLYLGDVFCRAYIGGNINNSALSTITSNGLVVFNAPNADQNLNAATYDLNNVSFTNDAPTAIRTKNIYANVSVSGSFLGSNLGGASLIGQINLYGNQIIAKTPSARIGITSYVRLLTNITAPRLFYSGYSLNNILLDPLSFVRFNNTGNSSNQDIPPLTYGNVELQGTGTNGEISYKYATISGVYIIGNLSGVSGNYQLNDGGLTHTLAGDWLIPSNSYNPNASTSTFILNGANQNIGPSNSDVKFMNIVFANTGGTVSILPQSTGNNVQVNILKDAYFNAGSNVLSTAKPIYISGNWINTLTGTFQHNGSTLFFNGTAPVAQIISSNSSSYFNNININRNGSANITVTAMTDLSINGSLTLANGASATPYGVLDITNRHINLSGNLTKSPGTSIIFSSITGVHFNGNSAQTISNGGTEDFLSNVTFSGSGTKTFNNNGGGANGGTYANTHIYTGNLLIASGSTLNASSLNINLTNGNWTGDGTFQHTATLSLSGTNQSFSGANFNGVNLGGSGLKSLLTNTDLGGSLTIQSGVTLVPALSNYSFNVSGNWTNNGVFVEKTGTVNMLGNSSNINTGAITAPTSGKSFYNLIINKNVGQTSTMGGHLDILNDLTINQGTLSFAATTFGGWIGREFLNTGGIYTQNNVSALNFINTVSGTYNFNPGSITSTYGNIIFNTSNATYNLSNNINISGTGRSLQMLNGTLSLAGFTMNMLGGGTAPVISIAGGTLDVSAGSQILLTQGNSIINAGGIFKLVGSPYAFATLARHASATSGFTVTQTGGTFHAKNYIINGLNNTNTVGAAGAQGIVFRGGTIDPLDNFSAGTFTNGFPGSAQYINMDNYTIPGMYSLSGVTFNGGPNNNLRRVSVAGANFITFINATGALAGSAYENDNPALGAATGNFRWIKAGKTWTNGSGDGLWHTSNNWSDNFVPTANDTVYLDHTNITSAYTVSVAGANASAYRLIIDKENATAAGINLILTASNARLDVTENLNILSGTTLSGANASNVVAVGRNWLNSGSFVAGNGTVLLNGSLAGTNTITQGNSRFNTLSIAGTGTTYLLNSTLSGNNVYITAGNLDVSTGNLGIYVSNTYVESGGGILNPNNGTVFFTGANQTIIGSNFYNISTAGTGIKTINSGPTIRNNLVISPNTTVDGLNNTLFIGGNFTNNSAWNAFSQNGTGAVLFNSTAAQTISNGTQPTIFNHLYLAGAGNKTIASNLSVTGDFIVNSGSGTANVQTFSVIAPNPSSTFTLNSTNTFFVQGANNFPSGFGTYLMANNSTVEYRADINQTIAGLTYGNLTVSTTANPTASIVTKTANGNIIAQGNINVGRSANDVRVVLDMASKNADITLGGNLSIVTTTSQIIWGTTGTLLHNGGGWAIDPDITGFNNLIMGGTGTKTMGANLTTSGIVQVINGTTFTMGTNTLIGQPSNTFTLSAGSTLNSAIPSTSGVAFPSGFGGYIINATSTTNINSNSNSQLIAGVAYGNLNINTNNSGSPIEAYLSNNITVSGNLISNTNAILIDNNYSIDCAGAIVDLRNYPNPSPISNINLYGNNQTLYNSVNNVDANFPGIIASGTGTKIVTSNGCAENVNIYGDIMIKAGVTLNIRRNTYWYGNRFINNGGTYDHISGCNSEFRAAGNAPQVINPGINNTFYQFRAMNTVAGVIFSVSGGNFNNIFAIDPGANVQMGNGLTHNFSSSFYQGGPPATSTIEGNWTTTGTNFILNGGNMNIPPLTLANLTIAGNGTKNMVGDLAVRDLIISGGVTLNTNSNNTTPSTSDNNISISGSFISNGTFAANQNKVTFNGNTSPVQIQTNGSSFYNLDVIPSGNVSYTLLSNTNRISRAFNLGCGAIFGLNSNTLYMGSNIASGKVYSIAGILHVDAAASLLFNNNGSQSIMTVSGSCAALSVIGLSFGNLALVSVESGAAGNGTIINIDNGARIAAKYYSFYNLADAGLYVGPSATISNTENFSDGSFTNLRNTGGGNRFYLSIESNTTTLPSITGISFNYSGTPNANTYNVSRSTTATGILYFNNPLGGVLGAYNYEYDPANVGSIIGANTGKILWPITQTLVWTGNIDTDWHNPLNWSPNQVPTILDNIQIPNRPNDPRIANADASCRDITLTDGALQFINNYNLTVNGSMFLGTGTNSASISSAGSASKISMNGAWTKNANSIFIPGLSTVEFNCAPGSYQISNGTSPFYNLVLNNSPVTYQLVGATVNITGSLVIDKNATLAPSTNNYVINLSRDFLKTTGSTFSNAVTQGTVNLMGGDQSITGMNFWNLSVTGTGTKYFYGVDTVQNNVSVLSNMTSDATNIHYFGTRTGGTPVFTLNQSGKYDDGGQSHYFQGSTWASAGTYTGTGTMTFNRNGTQIITTVLGLNIPAQFNNIYFNPSNAVTLSNNVATTGNVDVNIQFGNNLNCQTFTFTNSNNLADFIVRANQNVYIRGGNSYPNGYANYNFDATSNTYYDAGFAQTIGGISYGILRTNNPNVKTLGGDISASSHIYLNNSTLDVSPNNYSINIGGSFFNNGAGSFISRQGQVIFDGQGTAQQWIYTSNTGAKDFYQLTVNRSGTSEVLMYNNPVNTNLIRDNLYVLGGTFRCNGNVTISGDLFATAGTLYPNEGHYILNQAGGSANIQTNGSTVLRMTINAPGTTYSLQDNLNITANLDVQNGIFDGNSKVVNIGNNNPTHGSIINGKYIVGAGGTLGISNQATFIVGSSGIFEAIGTPSSIAKITGRVAGNRYNFVVNGGISAQYYLFEYMNTSGIQINSTATIDGVNNLSNGTFTNGVGGGTFLVIDNTQTMTISGVSFPINPGGTGPINVSKPNATSGVLYFDNATGVFAGETFDNDPYDNIPPYNTPPYLGLIKWTGPITLTWTGNVSSDWFTAGNWSSSVGGGIVPTGAENVVIPVSYVTAPIINNAGALSGNLTLFGNLSINTASSTGVDLRVNNDLLISGGSLSTNSGNDNLAIAGNFTRTTGFTNFNIASTVSFTGSNAIRSINNNTNSFPNVEFTGNATFLLSSLFLVNGDLTIKNGTVDGSSVTIFARKNFVNQANFNSGTGTVTLSPAAGGIFNFTPGASLYNSISLNGTSPFTYNQVGSLSTKSNLTLNSNATYNLNGQTINLGVAGNQLVVNNGGIFNANGGSFIRLSANGSINVNSGGTFNLVGTDVVNIATISRQTTGNIGITVNSGGTFAAKYYLVEYLNTSGLVINSGATINPLYNFSEGTFSNGATGGRYLTLSNTFANMTVTNVTFNSGPSTNVFRNVPVPSGIATFNESKGLLANYFYESDNEFPVQKANSGSLQWTYDYPVAYWFGYNNSNWYDASNWEDQAGLPIVPTNNTNTYILDQTVSCTPCSNTYPLLTTAGFTRNLTINSNAKITLSGANLSVAGAMTAQTNSRFIVTTTTASSIKVLDLWEVLGQFTPGTSTVELVAPSGTNVITNGTNSFYNFMLNSSTGGANFLTTNSLSILNDLTINSGTFSIGSSGHIVTVGGNWLKNGNFVSNGATVLFNKNTGTQSILGIGNNFGTINITSAGNKTLYLTNNITLTGSMIINGSNCTLNGGTSTIDIRGNWNNTARQFISQGTVNFNGTSTQSISRSGGETFNNVNILGASTKILNKDIIINGLLNLSSGVISTGVNKVSVSATGAVSGGSNSSFVNGNLQKYVTTGTGIAINYETGVGQYLPLLLTFPNVATAGNITVKANDLDHPNISSCLNPTKSVNKYWSVSGSAVSPLYFNALFRYNTSNYDAGSNPLNFVIGEYFGGNWAIQTLGSITGTSIEAVAVSNYGDFQIAEIGLAGGLTATASANPVSPICQGTAVTFTATGTNIGATPTYRWLLNNSLAGSSLSVFTTTSLMNADVVRVIITSSGVCYQGSVVTSNGVSMAVTSTIGNNLIASVQTVCSGVIPSSLTGSNPTGGNGAYTYLWQRSTTNSITGFSAATGTNNAINYTFPASLSNTTWYRRIITSGACTSTIPGIEITVTPVITGNTVAANQTICYNTAPNALTGGALSGGTGVYSIVWQVSTLSGSNGYALATGVNTTPGYIPGILTTTSWFTRVVNSGACTSTATGLQITVSTSGIWLGTVSQNWNNAANWCGASTPTLSNNILINSGVPNYPMVDAPGGAAGSITINSGAFLSISGSNTLTLTGSLINNGVINAFTGSGIAFTGSADQTITGVNTFYNMYISKSSTTVGVVLGADQNVLHELVLGTNSKLVTTGHIFSLISSSITGTARLANVPVGSGIVGNITMERFIPAKIAFRLLSSPMSNAQFTEWQKTTIITGNGTGSDYPTVALPLLHLYAEPVAGDQNKGFNRINGLNTLMVPGRGYRALIFGDRTIDLRATTVTPTNTTLKVAGIPNVGNVSLPVSYTTSTGSNITADGWNLVGNPYPSQIDWNLVTTLGAGFQNIDNAIYILDPDPTSTASGTYFNYVDGVATGSRSSLAQRPNPNIIPSSQAFFVKAKGANPVLNLNESVKVGTSPVTDNFRQEIIKDLLYVAIENSTVNDNTAIRFKSTATTDFDGSFDAYKLSNSAINISSFADNNLELSINSLPSLTNVSRSIPLNVKSNTKGTHKFRFSNLASFDSYIEIRLVDKYLHTSTTVNENSAFEFEITSVSGTQGAGRFELQFVPQTGDITVGLSPDSLAANTNLKWSIDNGATWYANKDTVRNIPATTQTITFSDTEGWNKPSPVRIDIVPNTTNTAVGIYTPKPQYGSLTAILSPASISKGRIKTQWRINNGPWLQSNQLVDSIPVGKCTISFIELAGYTKPENIIVNILPDVITSLSGEYFISTTPGVEIESPKDTAAIEGIAKVTPPSANVFSVNIYPNPIANETVWVELINSLGNTINVEIINQTGIVIYDKNYKNESNAKSLKLKLDIFENLPQGIYIVKCKSEGSIIQSKVVKTNQ